MESITKFKAFDGAEFSLADDCLKHETLLAEIALLEKQTIGRRPDSCDFSNGDGYIQHNKPAIDALLAGVRRLGQFKDEDSFGYIGRCLDDSGSPLYRLFVRFWSTDKMFREWGQPYYALHPGTGKNEIYPTAD